MTERAVAAARGLPDIILADPERHSDPATITQNIRKLNEDFAPKRSAAIEALSLSLRLPLHPEMREIIAYNLVDKLADKDYSVRRSAIIAVGDAGDVSLVPVARRIAEVAGVNGSADLAEEKDALIEALFRMKDVSALKTEDRLMLEKNLCNLAQSDSNYAVRASACRLLGYGSMNSEEIVKTLNNVRDNDPVQSVSQWAAAALENIAR